MIFAPKIADVYIWRTLLSTKCPHWKKNPLPDCRPLLWTASTT